MSTKELLLRIVLVLAVVVMMFTVVFVFIQALWAWVIPDVFSGAVSQGILPAALSFGQAVKLSILISILWGKSYIHVNKTDKE